MPGSNYLNSRCAVSTFKLNARPLLDMLEEESKKILREVGVFQLFEMPSLPQNILMLYVLVRAFNRDKQAFMIGNNYLKLTVNEVALILGLPNRGVDLTFVRLPCTDLTHKELIEEMNNLAIDDWSPTLESRRVDALIRYLVNVFFFPLKGMKIPASLYKIHGLSDFVKYNWPKAIHQFLLSQVDALNQASVVKKVGVNLGYLEGCATVLLVWLYEHTNVQMVENELARPRICRWSARKSYRAHFCFKLLTQLQKRNEGKPNFVAILKNEECLLAEEEDDSDFEPVKKKGLKVNEVADQADLELKKEIEDYIFATEEQRVTSKEQNQVLRKVRKQLAKRKVQKEEIRKAEESLFDEGWRGLEVRLQSFIKVEVERGVESIKLYCESWFKRLEEKSFGGPQRKQETPPPLPVSAPKSDLSIIKIEDPVNKDNFLISSLVRNVKSRNYRKKKDSPIKAKVKVKYEVIEDSYPGKSYISSSSRKVIEVMMENFPESSDTVLNRGNILMTRGAMDDLLGGRWLHNTHLNAYALHLKSTNKQSKRNVKNFFYVSSDYAVSILSQHYIFYYKLLCSLLTLEYSTIGESIRKTLGA